MNRSRVIMLLTIGIAFTMIVSGLSLYPSEKTSNNFSPTINYVYTFSESGLSSSITQWSVTLTGVSTKTAAPGNNIVWTLTSGGSRTYTIGSVPGYSSSPSSGSILYGVTVAIAFSGSPEVPSISGITASPNPTDINIPISLSASGVNFNDVNGAGYYWTNSLGGTYLSVYGPSSSSTNQWTSDHTTSDTVSLYATNDAGSSSTKTVSVSANSDPSISITASATSTDANMAIDFTSSGSGGSGSYSYSWYEKISTGSYSQFSTSQNPAYTFTSAGTYYVYAGITDSVGGTGTSSTLTITVNSELSAGSITSSKNPAIEGDSVTFSISASGGISPYTYHWFLNGASVGSDSSSYAYTFSTSGTYTIKMNLTDSIGAYSVATLTEIIEQTYTVSFTESGLSGITWYANISGESSLSGTTSTLSTLLINGTYYYSISSDVFYYGPDPASGSLTVSGSTVSISITFTAYTYTASFQEFGLIDITWYVNISGKASMNSNASTQSMSLPNGTYYYNISTAAEYLPAPAFGSFVISGNTGLVNITFIRYYLISFEESGLSGGGAFWVYALDSNFSGNASTPITIQLTQTSLSYYYGPMSVDWFIPINASGSLTYSNDSIITLKFTQYMFQINVVETGLSSGTEWYVYFGSHEYSSTTNAISFTVFEGYTSFIIGGPINYTVYPHSAWNGNVNSNMTYDITFGITNNSLVTHTQSYTLYAVIVGAIIVFAVIAAAGIMTYRRWTK